VVPDVDAAQLQRCAASKQAAALFGAAGLPVLDGSRSECGWRRDPGSPVPGLTPLARMPVLIRADWVQNSNDSFYLTNPAHTFSGISPMVGTAAVNRPRTRIGIIEIREMVAAGRVDKTKVQQALFRNRNYVGGLVMDDLLAACPSAPTTDARDGCAALAGWDRTSNADAKGAHVFREFWRRAATIPGVWRVPFDPADPINTPSGLKMSDDAVRGKVWEAMGVSVKAVRDAGFPLDAPLGTVQAKPTPAGPIAIHGGDEFEGVLNKVETKATGGITKQGLDVDYGTSYLQTVTFDERGPVAYAVLTDVRTEHESRFTACDRSDAGVLAEAVAGAAVPPRGCRGGAHRRGRAAPASLIQGHVAGSCPAAARSVAANYFCSVAPSTSTL
jgi:acyl-homoserine-lactone acylase